MLLFRIFSWEDSLEQHSLARGTAGATPGILTLDAPRQAVGKDRQTEILFVRSFRLLQLQPCLTASGQLETRGNYWPALRLALSRYQVAGLGVALHRL